MSRAAKEFVKEDESKQCSFPSNILPLGNMLWGCLRDRMSEIWGYLNRSGPISSVSSQCPVPGAAAPRCLHQHTRVHTHMLQAGGCCQLQLLMEMQVDGKCPPSWSSHWGHGISPGSPRHPAAPRPLAVQHPSPWQRFVHILPCPSGPQHTQPRVPHIWGPNGSPCPHHPLQHLQTAMDVWVHLHHGTLAAQRHQLASLGSHPSHLLSWITAPSSASTVPCLTSAGNL